MKDKKEEYRKRFTEDDCPGLDYINEKTKLLYGKQAPSHWATIVPYDLGGEDPLWAVDCYESKIQTRHLHYITLGFTNLFYDEECALDEINGYGFELTFRHLKYEGDPEKPVWAVNLLQNLAKYIFATNNVFDEYHYMSANGPIRLDTETDITAIVFLQDSELNELTTPNGYLKFLQLYGITTKEYESIKSGKYSAEELIKSHQIDNPLLITDLKRK